MDKAESEKSTNERSIHINFVDVGEKINDGGRAFKSWFTEFTLVYSPIFIVLGLILTGIDLFLNLGIGNNLAFRIPWSIAQLLAVDGLWFAVWNRILTDEYKWCYWPYHLFIVLFGLAMTTIAIIMNYIIFTQDYMGLHDSVAAMRFIGLPVSLFLLVRSILLMLTATLAIVLDKVMRVRRSGGKRSINKPEKSTSIPAPINHTPAPASMVGTLVSEEKPAQLSLPAPNAQELHPVNELTTPRGAYREIIKVTMLEFIKDGRAYTYNDVVAKTGASLQTVKKYAPGIKQELAQGTQEP